MAAAVLLKCDDPACAVGASSLELAESFTELITHGLLSICRTRRIVFVLVSLASLMLLLLLPTMLPIRFISTLT